VADAFRGRLGHDFGAPDLLAQALTHRSHGARHNERLEFVGDAVLNCVVALALYQRFPQTDEGELSRARASLVNRDTLARIARRLGLGEAVRLGEGELRSGGADRGSILADALEAVFGAVFLDGGYPAARGAVLAVFGPRIASLDPERPAKDAKTQLQEALQARHEPLPEYQLVAKSGPEHHRVFEVVCRIAGLGLQTTGRGTSLQRAQQDAARAMLERLPA
jgi:ribonuclease-3